MLFHSIWKNGRKIGPHVSHLRSRWFLFQGAQVRFWEPLTATNKNERTRDFLFTLDGTNMIVLVQYKKVFTHHFVTSTKYHTQNTGWWKCIGCHNFISRCQQKSPICNGSFAERDLQPKASYATLFLTHLCESGPRPFAYAHTRAYTGTRTYTHTCTSSPFADLNTTKDSDYEVVV